LVCADDNAEKDIRKIKIKGIRMAIFI